MQALKTFLLISWQNPQILLQNILPVEKFVIVKKNIFTSQIFDFL